MKYLYILVLLIAPALCLGQTITGTVTNERNDPLAGVTVSYPGTHLQTSSNDKGMFSLPAVAGQRIVRFTFTGMEPLELDIADKKVVSAVMVKSTSKLDEVQIIAYGTNTQRYNLGSVSKVSADDIDKQAISNPLEALQGQVAGLTISASSGIPGASFNVQVRGQNTLKSSIALFNPRDNPLFIIDGVPFAPQNGNINQFNSLASPGDAAVYNNAFGGISPFNSINPSDIESIEVLKDADATAIYGSRGGNGVILITTKKGRAGRTGFNLNVRDGVTFIGNTMPMMNTEQYLATRKEAFANDGLVPNSTYNDPAYAPDLTVFDQNRYTDWKKFAFGNTARDLNLNGAVYGGNASTQFRVGGGFNRDTYIFPGDFADSRANFSSNIHHTSPDKKFSIDFTTIYSYDHNNSSGSPNALTANTLEPNSPAVLDSRGYPLFIYNGVILDGYTGGNPFAYLKRTYSIATTNLSANALMSYQIYKGLMLRTSLGYNTLSANEYSGVPAITLSPSVNPVSSASFGVNNFSTWIIEPQLEYKNTIKKNAFSVLFGSTFQRNSNARTESDGYGYTNDALLGSITGAATTLSTDAFNEYKYNAVFGRISYRYDDKYLLSINGRRDGSSRFGPSKQFGNFGSVGAGWIFSEESLIKNMMPALSYGKLRASYGITGSDGIPDYQYLSRWSPTKNSYGGTLGYAPQNLFNPELSWASTKKLEFGLETGFIGDRLLFTASWYQNRSGDQLITYTLPVQTGFSSVYENWDAIVENSGWEFTMQASVLKAGSFKWNSRINFTLPENKLISFPNVANSSYSTIYFVGRSVNTVTGFSYAGVNPTTGLFQFTAANGQLTSTPQEASLGKLNDFTFLGTTDPKFYGGFQNSFSYGGVQLDVFTEFKKQLGVNYLAQVYSQLPGQEYNLPVSLLNRWQAPGQQAEFQKLSTQYNQAYDTASDFIESSGSLSDASYIRIKNVSLSYNIPAKLLQKLNVRALKFYATAQNLFTITNYKGNDPETQNFYGVPPLKTISFGLNLGL